MKAGVGRPPAADGRDDSFRSISVGTALTPGEASAFLLAARRTLRVTPPACKLRLIEVLRHPPFELRRVKSPTRGTLGHVRFPLAAEILAARGAAGLSRPTGRGGGTTVPGMP